MKNINTFEAHIARLGGTATNDEDLDFDQVSTLWDTINLLHDLMDDGYIRSGMWTITDPQEDLPIPHRSRFDTMESAQHWLDNIKPLIKTMSSMLDDFYN